MSDQTCDYVIVGGGTAGCVLANRLSAGGRHRVVLLEAGPADRSPWIHLPIGYGKTMVHDELNWGFHTEPEPHMNGRRMYTPRGRCLGGSSSINGLIYIRGQAADFDAWAQAGNPGWGWADVLPYFRRAEHNARGADAWHGADGPVHVDDIRERHPLMEAVIAGAGELGVAANADFNGAEQGGVGYYQLTTRKGLRVSAATAYLRPARRRANLRVITGAHVSRIEFNGGRASGVRYRRGESEFRIHARQEVILAAGALQSPQLLQCSGVGDLRLLGELGVPPVHHLPGVGENLQDHLQLRLLYRVAQPITTNDELRTLHGRLGIALRWLTRRAGPLAVGINQGGLFTRVLPESASADVQFHFATLSADMAGGKVHAWPGCTFSVCQLRPRSRGWVRARNASTRHAPAIRFNYLEHELDRRAAVAGIRFARRLAGTEALRGLLAGEYRPGPGCADDDDSLLGFAREHGATIFHPVGTCRMGRDELAVVDERLRVHGIGGLRVVDASVMPTLVSGNTCAATVMIAERAADLILADAEASLTAA
ncbi:choline dehydrogenase [Pseudothauera nasutitermitis]|uniref:Choline dehydrogenase n=1 Tax=Pseudothauera nasutitermitis TaxID=2565930 RepID=A0A4S4B3M8_9RHOO|nr:GMC family oxidoreductase N-terminal domain-containing protein [Pseudothauera nasutitermitis]THF67280.1 choline dehydrogenase [Pseudothauera nasutitermitis]